MYSLYKTVLLAAKRALEISQGAPPLVSSTSKQPSTIALEEIRAGQVSYELTDAPPAAKDGKKKAKGG